MMAKTVKIVVTVLVVGGTLGYLVKSSLAENLEYYKQVDEIAANVDKWTGPRLKMGGHVVEGSIMNKPGTMDYIFDVTRNEKTIRVYYTGVVPDTFKDDAEVVVSGRMSPKGHFEATEVVAKCPSKYEAAEKQGLTHPGEVPMGAQGS